jgi:hypothetical protein
LVDNNKHKTSKIMKIKSLLKLMMASTAIIFATAWQTKAATTNVVQNINFELTFYEQGPTNNPTTNIVSVTVNRERVTTKDIIAALGAATSNSFSGDASLVFVRNASPTNDEGAIEIKDGTNVVDVSDFFTITHSKILVHGSLFGGRGGLFNSAFDNTGSGIGDGATYGILHLTLTNAPDANLTLNLHVNGFAISTYRSIVNNSMIMGVDTTEADVAGTGVDANGVPVVIQGTISLFGRRTEIE